MFHIIDSKLRSSWALSSKYVKPILTWRKMYPSPHKEEKQLVTFSDWSSFSPVALWTSTGYYFVKRLFFLHILEMLQNKSALTAIFSFWVLAFTIWNRVLNMSCGSAYNLRTFSRTRSWTLVLNDSFEKDTRGWNIRAWTMCTNNVLVQFDIVVGAINTHSTLNFSVLKKHPTVSTVFH